MILAIVRSFFNIEVREYTNQDCCYNKRLCNRTMLNWVSKGYTNRHQPWNKELISLTTREHERGAKGCSSCTITFVFKSSWETRPPTHCTCYRRCGENSSEYKITPKEHPINFQRRKCPRIQPTKQNQGRCQKKEVKFSDNELVTIHLHHSHKALNYRRRCGSWARGLLRTEQEHTSLIWNLYKADLRVVV